MELPKDFIAQYGKAAVEFALENRESIGEIGKKTVAGLKKVFKKKSTDDSCQAESTNPCNAQQSNDLVEVYKKLDEIEKIVECLAGGNALIKSKLNENIATLQGKVATLSTENAQINTIITNIEKTVECLAGGNALIKSELNENIATLQGKVATLSTENAQINTIITNIEKNTVKRNLLYVLIGISTMALLLSIVSIIF